MWLTKAVVLQSLRLNCLCLLGVQALINKVVLFVEGILSTEQQKKKSEPASPTQSCIKTPRTCKLPRPLNFQVYLRNGLNWQPG